ncbi:MAG: VWA domain-containing protein [Acidobacteria bacterium]|nr:VWA domain-containing protein [Acidobacteriota bacterium]
MSALAANVVRFGRVLHGLGVRGAAGRMPDVLSAVESIDIGRREDFFYTLRCLLVNLAEDLPVFDRAFAAFWKPAPGARTQVDVRPMGQDFRIGAPVVELWTLHAGTGEGGPAAERVELATYSARELLRQKDFSRMTGEELAEAQALVETFRWNPGMRLSRRWEPGAGSRPDLRKLFRIGETFRIPTRARKWKRRPLVVLCDISGSMDRYSRMLLRFAHCLAGGYSRLEVFVFATRLTRISLALRRKKTERALAEAGAAVRDWGGGTRIGDALRRFHVDWSRRVLGHGPVVLLISDGWDRGDPEDLAREMARLHRSCHRLIWLNPLLGSPAYEPLTRGMRAALPYVDDFLPVHNIASLAELARLLRTLE